MKFPNTLSTLIAIVIVTAIAVFLAHRFNGAEQARTTCQDDCATLSNAGQTNGGYIECREACSTQWGKRLKIR